MSKIYLPSEFLNKPCYVVNNDYIRVYDTVNYNQQNKVYDIFVNQDYMIRESNANYTSNTICDSLNTYTDDVFYRTDFYDFCIIFLFLCVFLIYLPLFCILKTVKKGRVL